MLRYRNCKDWQAVLNYFAEYMKGWNEDTHENAGRRQIRSMSLFCPGFAILDNSCIMILRYEKEGR